MLLNSTRQWDGNVVTRSLLRNPVVGLSQVGKKIKKVSNTVAVRNSAAARETQAFPTRKEVDWMLNRVERTPRLTKH